MWLFEDEDNEHDDGKLVFDELTYENVASVFRIFEGQDAFKDEPDGMMPRKIWERIKIASRGNMSLPDEIQRGIDLASYHALQWLLAHWDD